MLKMKELAENEVGEIRCIAKIEQDQVCLLNRHWVLSTGGSTVEGRTVWGNGTQKVIVLIPGFFIKSVVFGPPPHRSLFHSLEVTSLCVMTDVWWFELFIPLSFSLAGHIIDMTVLSVPYSTWNLKESFLKTLVTIRLPKSLNEEWFNFQLLSPA